MSNYDDAMEARTARAFEHIATAIRLCPLGAEGIAVIRELHQAQDELLGATKPESCAFDNCLAKVDGELQGECQECGAEPVTAETAA